VYLPRIVITSGEPAGVGPDVCVVLAQQGWEADIVVAADARLLAALRPLVGAIDVTTMREANYSVDRQIGKVTPAAAAARLNAKIATGAARAP